MALTGQDASRPTVPKRSHKIPVLGNLETLLYDPLSDSPEEDMAGDDDDDDPELLMELNKITQSEENTEVIEPSQPTAENSPVVDELGSLLNTRLQMYILAEQNAKKTGNCNNVIFAKSLFYVQSPGKMSKMCKICLFCH